MNLDSLLKHITIWHTALEKPPEREYIFVKIRKDSPYAFENHNESSFLTGYALTMQPGLIFVCVTPNSNNSGSEKAFSYFSWDSLVESWMLLQDLAKTIC